MSDRKDGGAVNQCDGCRAGIPVVNGLHIDKDNPWNGMVCQADRYKADAMLSQRADKEDV